jgi:hypothetical protein
MMKTTSGLCFNIFQHDRLYYLQGKPVDNIDSVKVARGITEWHRILGHCNIDDILKLEGKVEGLEISSKHRQDCQSCILYKTVESRSKAPRVRATKIFELVHTDVEGPIQPVAIGGYKYILMFTDDFQAVILHTSCGTSLTPRRCCNSSWLM